MEVYGLIGKTLKHSFSPAYFAEKFRLLDVEGEYHLFELTELDELSALIQSLPELKGLNVTIPYKRQVLDYLDEVDPAAREIGAVNTIRINRDNQGIQTRGFNTDVIGFEQSLKPLLKEREVTSALVLGTGGSSEAVRFVLDNLGLNYTSVSRNRRPGVITYDEITRQVVEKNLLIINTTPLGMYPDIESKPELPYHFLGADHILYDLVYNPEQTAFAKAGLKAGASVKTGLEMLQLQAEASWRIWTR